MTVRRIALYVFLGVAVVAAIVMAFRPRPADVVVATVQRGPFVQYVEADGKTRVRERYIVSAPVAGVLQRISVEAGDEVQAGGVVATLVPVVPPLLDVRSRRQLEVRVSMAEAALARAQADAARARAARLLANEDLARARTLAAASAMTRRDLDRAITTAETAQKEEEAAASAVHVAQHERDLARVALEDWVRFISQKGKPNEEWSVRAPAGGRVLRVIRESEGVVPAGEPLLELADPRDLEVVVDVLSTDAVQIHPGAQVEFIRWGGPEALQGRVTRVEPFAITKVSALGVEEQRVNVIAEITSPPEQWTSLGDGYRVEARIVVYRSEDALQAPVGAFFRDRSGWATYAVVNGKAMRKSVLLGPTNGATFEVESGLGEGQTVIVHPPEAVHEGKRIRRLLGMCIPMHVRPNRVIDLAAMVEGAPSVLSTRRVALFCPPCGESLPKV